MSFFIVCMIMRSHNLLSFNLGIGDWRFSITRLEAKRFQINMSVMHTTIHHAAQKPHKPTQKGINGSKAHNKCNMHPQI